MYFKIYVILCLIGSFSARVILHDYNEIRDEVIKEESRQTLGGYIQLNEAEKIANGILMKWKVRELDKNYHNPQNFKLSKHYFTYRNEIQNSEVYQIIKRMPKGAALHIHSSMMLDADNLLKLTYEDHLYICYDNNDLQLQFSDVVPVRPCTHNWTLLSDLRNASNDVAALDMKIKQYFTLHLDDSNINADITTVWKRFDIVYHAIKSLISYRPVREKFFYQALQNFYNDNIIHIEIRSGLHGLYELDGTTHDGIYMARLYQNITRKFKKDHPDFMGVKLILTRNRKSDIEKVREVLDVAKALKEEMPDTFAGVDLVGQEDLGYPLIDFTPAFLEVKGEINFYFHGGETNWYGMETDENLIDAVLLDSKRIGHAYALLKHPSLINAIKEKDIALEVNVISNQVLSLVKDVRNHPLAAYMAMGLPVVLSSDDPGAWGADPLSHDFYVAFMGVASKRTDLRMLKQLAINSIKYSSLDSLQKIRAFEVFYKKWDEFVKDILERNLK